MSGDQLISNVDSMQFKKQILVIKGSEALLTPYLKHSFIQESSPKHGHSICANHSVVSSLQFLGLYLLTVQVEGDRLALHAVS